MKVAIVEPVGGHGGMNYYDMGLARALTRKRVDVIWYTCDRTTEASSEGIEILKTFRGVYGESHKIVRMLRFIVGLFLTLISCKKKRISIVHYHFFGLGPLEMVMCVAAKLFGFKVCSTIHDVESFAANGPSRFSRPILSLVNQFVVHNNTSLQELDRLASVVGVKIQTAIIPHGNYCSTVRRLDKCAARDSLGIPQGQNVLLFFGQIKAVKGLEVLLKSLPIVADTVPNVSLIVAGKVWKDDFSAYQEVIEGLNLSGFVRLDIRYIPDSEVDSYYSAADCVVLPYKKIYQSGVLLMAMSYGLPVVASNLDGMTEVVTDNVNGLIFEEGDSEDLADKVCDVFLDADMRERLGQSALAHMQEHYSWASVGEKTKAIYKGML